MDGFWAEAASVVVMAGGIAIIRIFLGSAKKDMETKVQQEMRHMSKHCTTVHGQVTESLTNLKEESQDLWVALNSHGHKGLEGNGNKVTR